MALVKCKECGAEISKKAEACPKCGAKPAKKTSAGTWLALIIIGLVVYGVMSAETGTSSGTNASGVGASSSSGSGTARYAHSVVNVRGGPSTDHEVVRQLQPRERVMVQGAEGDWSRIGPDEWVASSLLHQTRPPSQAELYGRGMAWSYLENEDSMSGRTSRSAHRRSLNQVEFDFPYADPQRATLELRNHPRFGRDVIFRIERGQFLCRIDSCSVRVRFGSSDPVTFEASEPESNDSTILFIRQYDRFVERTKEVDEVLIEATIYQEGSPVFRFDVTGLEWP